MFLYAIDARSCDALPINVIHGTPITSGDWDILGTFSTCQVIAWGVGVGWNKPCWQKGWTKVHVNASRKGREKLNSIISSFSCALWWFTPMVRVISGPCSIFEDVDMGVFDNHGHARHTPETAKVRKMRYCNSLWYSILHHGPVDLEPIRIY